MKTFKSPPFVALLGIVIALSTALSSQAQAIYSDNFEGTLGQWVGKSGGAHNGVIVSDPLSSGHGGVLAFTLLNSGGDIFSSSTMSYNGPLTLSFDYLGMPSPSGTPGNLGGYLGIAYTLNPLFLGSDHFWYAGSQFDYGVVVELADDGAWHHYNIPLNGTALGSFRLMIEDYDGSGGIPGDVFFDNIGVTVVPEPSAAAFILGFAGMIGIQKLWRRSS